MAETPWDAGVAAMFAASVAEFSHFWHGRRSADSDPHQSRKVYAIAGVGPMPKLATAKFLWSTGPGPVKS